MNLFAKLSISLVLGVAATAAIHFIPLSGALPIGVAIVIACLLAAVIGNAGAAGMSEGNAPARSAPSAPEAAPLAAEGKREQGKVKWFNVSKGFGFIIRENGEEIFVHFRSIRSQNKGRRGLKDGQAVSFVVVDSDKGPQAEDVEPL